MRAKYEAKKTRWVTTHHTIIIFVRNSIATLYYLDSWFRTQFSYSKFLEQVLKFSAWNCNYLQSLKIIATLTTKKKRGFESTDIDRFKNPRWDRGIKQISGWFKQETDKTLCSVTLSLVFWINKLLLSVVSSQGVFNGITHNMVPQPNVMLDFLIQGFHCLFYFFR